MRYTWARIPMRMRSDSQQLAPRPTRALRQHLVRAFRLTTPSTSIDSQIRGQTSGDAPCHDFNPELTALSERLGPTALTSSFAADASVGPQNVSYSKPQLVF